jgi:membrane protein YqaA with SNARE-associated domain
METSVSLFITAFLAATILPVASEAAVVAALTLSREPWGWILMAASLGNILGACVNWGLGRLASNATYAGWLPVSKTALEKAQKWYLKWGRAALLLSWAPIVGDAITVAAGALKEPLPTFLALVAIAKTGRYLALAFAVSSF